MARRRAAPKREILPDPKFGSELVARFVNHVMMCGKKSTAEKIVYGALGSAFDKLKGKIKDEELPLLEEGEGGDEGSASSGGGSIALRIFKKSLDTVCPTVEVRSRRVGGSTYQVPVEVRPNRRVALAMRWLVDAASARNEKTMALRLAGEIMDAFYGRGAAVKKREDTHRMAMANQAFAHFRW